MSTITKEQWLSIHEGFKKSVFKKVIFSLDGHEIICQKAMVAENRAAIIVWIDGNIKGACNHIDDEELRPVCRKIWRIVTRSYYKPKDVAEIEKIWGKREAKKRFPNLLKKREYFVPDYSTATTLVNKFKKIEGLELVTDFGAGSAKDV